MTFWRSPSAARKIAAAERLRELPAAVNDAGLDTTDLAAWSSQIAGDIVVPGDPDYDKARKISNAAFDLRPAAIVYCANESDVRISLQVADRRGLGFTLRTGGHSSCGYCLTTGIVIDLSRLNDVTILPGTRRALIGCGATFEKLYARLADHGLILPAGECGGVAVAGFMQGGGYGFASLKYGMNSDAVVSFRMMLADGRTVTATPILNSDLFWAVRGGTGNNFGILLSVEYQLWPLSRVWGWGIGWRIDTEAGKTQAAQALSTLLNEIMPTAPAEFWPQVMVSWQSTKKDLSDATPMVMIKGLFDGDSATGRKLIARLLALPDAIRLQDFTDDYAAAQERLFEQPHPIVQFPQGKPVPPEDKQARFVSKRMEASHWVDMFNVFLESPNTFSYMCLEIYGGAINVKDRMHSAFVHRDSAFSAFLDVWWYDAAEKLRAQAYLQRWCDAWAPFWNGEIYQNYPSPAVPDYRASYFKEAFPVLYAIKKKYDLAEKFKFEQSISPYPDRDVAPPNGPAELLAAIAAPIDYGNSGE